MKSIAGHYSVTSLIRETPQALLYRGHADADGKPVVLKVLRAEYPGEVELARLRHEYRIISSLPIAGVVRSYGLEKSGNGLALVLEDVGDRSLDQVIARGRVATLQALRIAVSMTRVLRAVHREGIIHKDIKPEHFFLRGDDSAVQTTLIDFGLATQLAREIHALQPATQLDGSVPYMAPEQTGRINRAVDRRSDLYSMGVTLYELLAGKRPFEAQDWLELVHSHIARVPKALHESHPEIPAALSSIVAKLLEKEPERRYQSAAGLASDLERCLDQLESVGRIESFELGENDRSEELRIPQKAYGRELPRTQLLQAFERVAGGASELLLVGGHSGIGKSALVGELKPRLLGGGYLGAGKFDYHKLAAPYAAIAQACRGFVQAWLSEPKHELELRRRAILEAVGGSGQIMVELVPELALVIGAQPEAPKVGPGEAQRRFELLFQRFLGAIASERHPLVLFLDDLQWADAASLRLVQVALSGSVSHLLLVGTYRNNETDAGHALWLVVNELKDAGCRIEQLQLGPLSLESVRQMLSDCLYASPSDVAGLAEVLLRKTQGNPLYLTQLLGDLHREGLLRFDGEAKSWRWDLASIDGRLATDDVVDFLLERLGRLELPSRWRCSMQHASVTSSTPSR